MSMVSQSPVVSQLVYICVPDCDTHYRASSPLDLLSIHYKDVNVRAPYLSVLLQVRMTNSQG